MNPMEPLPVPPEWIDQLRVIVRRDDWDANAGPGNSMMLRHPKREWFVIMLPYGGTEFVCEAERDAALMALAAPTDSSRQDS